MAARRRTKVVFPADIHRIAAEIRRQALRNPDKDPVVPGTRKRTTRTTAKKRRPAGRTAKRKTGRK